jgi:CelD/BcsL family acetyltransferase involved in cellulose biosynthesis
MQVEPLQPDAEAEWDAFCRAQANAFFWHTTDWTRFLLAAKPERAGRSLAFAIREGRELLAVVPLAIEQDELVLGAAPCWAPAVRDGLDEPRAAAVLRASLEHVDALAAEHGAVRAAFQLTPLTPAPAAQAFAVEAIRAGYLDVGRVSQVLELEPGADALRRGMSKGHRAAVKRGVAEFAVELLSGPAASNAALHAFRALHEAAAGRQTRPPETFDQMAEWAQHGEGLLAMARSGDDYVGGSYVSVFGGRAYYLAAAMDRSLSHQPVGHALQWAAIEWLLARGVTSYELGLQQFGPLLHDVPTDKERNISRFKRGFGGVLRLAPAWEKWYSAAAFRDTVGARAEAYSTALDSIAAAHNRTTAPGSTA